MIMWCWHVLRIHDRNGMEASWPAASAAQHIRAATLHRQGCSGRHPLGTQDRRAMERFTRTSTERLNLLETFEGLGGGRGMGYALAGVHTDSRRATDPRLGTVLHRRQLCSGEKRGLCVGKTKRGKGTKWMVVADGQGLPVGGTLESASPAEVRLAPEAICNASERLGRWPCRLIADKAYDADWLRHVLKMVGGELICPHRRGRKKPPQQDGRKLRRYRKRWKIERLFAWLGNWRRLLIRHERLLTLYSGFFKIACIMILVRHF